MTYQILGIQVTKQDYERYLEDQNRMKRVSSNSPTPPEPHYDPYPEDFEHVRDQDPPAECLIDSSPYLPSHF